MSSPAGDAPWEIVRSDLPRGRYRFVLFDFDGTLSLIRAGWADVMVPMMVEEIRRTGTGEDEAALTSVVADYVAHLTGRQTIYQMIRLAEEVKRRGGTPQDPLVYKHRYHDLLMARIGDRIRALETGQAVPGDWSVAGSHALLENLRARGLSLYLASGTDAKYVHHEAGLLAMTHFFGPHIYGALDDYRSFSKQMIVEKILREHGLAGDQLLGFGDGYVEIEEIKRVGGTAVAVASEERTRQGIDPWKRERLLRAGADLVVPDYRHQAELVDFLMS